MTAIRHWWIRALVSFYLLLCLRFIVATIFETSCPPIIPFVLLIGGISVGWFISAGALFGFLALLPVLTGLNDLGILPGIYLPSYIFAAISIGSSVQFYRQQEIQTSAADKWRSLAILLSKVFASIIVIALVTQLTTNCNVATGRRFIVQAVFGYSDPLFFLTSGFIWLQGWFLFMNLEFSETISLSWAKVIILIFAVVMSIFIWFQLSSKIPLPLSGYAYYSPFEDISSFGSIAVTVYIFLIASITYTSLARFLPKVALIAVIVGIVIASWSRAAWLSAAIFSIAVATMRLSLKWRIAFCGTLIVALLIINIFAHNQTWVHNPYLSRLIALGRIENPGNKSPERIRLYHKAFAMIRERPIMGAGLGTFFVKSPKYADSDDPIGGKPDFAHDVLLQLATEMGIPTAGLFLGFIAAVFYVGIRDYSAIETLLTVRLQLLAAILALAAYLMTQITANSLNEYVSNQFVFWYLAACLISLRFVLRQRTFGQVDARQQG
jgi:O-antigen ligase